MCGRFINRLTWREIVALYRLSVPATPERNLPARYNICPTDTIDTVVEEDGKRDLVPIPLATTPASLGTPNPTGQAASVASALVASRAGNRSRRCPAPRSGA
jgi:putative SOS response-associated peptidase YedK